MIKRLIFCVLTALLTSVSMEAARALSEPFTVTQPDGTQLTLTGYGDEHANWLTTTDGTLVVYTEKGYFVAAIGDDGQLSASEVLAHQPADRQVREVQYCQVQRQRQQMFYQQVERNVSQARRAMVETAQFFPHEGQPKSLVILVNFSDVKFSVTDPKKSFEQYFNAEQGGIEKFDNNEDKNFSSVREYFNKSSHGKFIPQFTVVGPVDLPQTMAYYGGSAEGSSSDANFPQFCEDAIQAVDDQVDFREFVNGTDNCAELVCVIYAGYGQAANSHLPNTIWPKCSFRNILTNDGDVRVNYMNCNSELGREKTGTDINGIGVFVHEMSHGMGLPDLYATNKSAQINNQTPEFWDLMDYGEHANNGYAPVPFTAWEQEAMGWINVEELTEQQTVSMKPLMWEDGKAYKFSNGGDKNECFYLENVQARNKENGIPGFSYGHGLLVWHVAYARDVVAMGDYPNNTAGMPRVCVVPADGLVINGYRFVTSGEPTDEKPYTQAEYTASLKGDTFPYSYQEIIKKAEEEGEQDETTTITIDQLTAEQKLPNYLFYNGEQTTADFSLKNIKEEDGVVTFDFDNGVPSCIHTVNACQVDDAYYTLDGRRLAGPPVKSGLYIHQGRKVICR